MGSWQAKPHIGTDKLPAVVKSIRERIISAGGEVRFLTRLADIELSGGAVCSVVLEEQTLALLRIECPEQDASFILSDFQYTSQVPRQQEEKLPAEE